MTGNDLQPLEEEVSREEDDSFVIQVEVHKAQSQLMKNSQKSSMTSLESCNYNGHMEEANIVMADITNATGSVKIFDAQYQNTSSGDSSMFHN